MTNKEAIRRMEFCRNFLANNYSDMGEPNVTAFNMAIKALEQEPCDDCISRGAVLEQINCWIGSGEYRYTNATHYLTRRVQDIPSVTPKAKTGHWIEKDDFDGDVHYDCSECGESFCLIDGTPTDNLYNYCPICGAKMVEPQESEEEDDRD